jgi:hypothetical protein
MERDIPGKQNRGFDAIALEEVRACPSFLC